LGYASATARAIANDTSAISIELVITGDTLTIIYNPSVGAVPVSLADLRLVNGDDVVNPRQFRLDQFGPGVVSSVTSPRCLQLHLGEINLTIPNCTYQGSFIGREYSNVTAFWGNPVGAAFVPAATILIYWDDEQLGTPCFTPGICSRVLPLQ
jgi:hypothetical protein